MVVWDDAAIMGYVPCDSKLWTTMYHKGWNKSLDHRQKQEEAVCLCNHV